MTTASLLARARKELRDHFGRDRSDPMAHYLEGAAWAFWSIAAEIGKVPCWEQLVREEREKYEAEQRERAA
jgi:hypothetical protein